MNDLRFTELLAGYFSGNISDEEKGQLFAQMEANPDYKLQYEEMKQVWEMTTVDPISFETDKSVAWNNLEKQIQTEISATEIPTAARVVRRSFGRQLLRYAAVFLLIGTVGFFGYRTYQSMTPDSTYLTEVSTGSNERKELTLPDGSEVWLNENSKLLFAEAFKKREIILEGEAFFDVKRMEDSPFVIESGEARTVVLGTSFNVRAYPKENIIEVTVESGKVAFSKPGGATSPALLTKGESAVLVKTEGRITKELQKTPNATSWKTDKLVFDDVPILEVIKSVERYFDVDVKVENEAILNCPFKGTFTNADEKLGELMGAIEFGLGLEVRSENSTYVLSGNGCE